MKKISLYILIILIYGCSSLNFKKETEQGISAFKFLNVIEYPYSANEELFWDQGKINLAKIEKLRISEDWFKKEILKMPRIDKGLSEDFEYAFIFAGASDTVFACFELNLWTLKQNGNYIFFEDKSEELEHVLIDYSSFFSECF